MSTATGQARASQTPILDRLSPWPAPAKSGFWRGFPRSIFQLTVFWGLFSLLVSGDGTFFSPVQQGMLRDVQQISADDWAGVRVILTCFGIALAWFFAILVHELGHLVAGLAMGFRFKFLHIGRLQINRSFRFSWTTQSNHKRLGGVIFYPQEMKARPWRRAFMVLSGPGSNLAAGVAVFILPYQKSIVSGAFILMCAYLGTVNLAPWASDGKSLLTIMLRRRDHEAELALAEIVEQIREGIELEKLSPALIAQAASIREKSPRTLVAHLTAFRASFQRRDYEGAAASLEQCFTWSPWAPARLRQGLIYSAAVLQAYRARIDVAEQWYAELPSKTTLLSRFQVEGALLEARGDLNGALGKIAECESQLSQESNEKKRESKLRQLRKWKAEIEQRLVPAPSPQV